MPVRRFADTNLWIYAHLKKAGDPRCEIAAHWVETEDLVISNQVLHEYYAVMLRNQAPDVLIQTNIRRMAERCPVFCLDMATLEGAMSIRERYRFSWWDSLIVASALQAECDELCTEDLQHGQVIDNRLAVVNPFLS